MTSIDRHSMRQTEQPIDRTELSRRIRLERQRLAVAARLARRRAIGSECNIANGVLRNGIVVVQDFFEPEQVSRFQKAIPPIENFDLSPEGNHSRYIANAVAVEPLYEFFEHPKLVALMTELIGPSAHRKRSTIQHRDYIGRTGAFEWFFHMDTWLPRFKAFLYLCDVGEDNAPLEYVPRSHYGRWRARHERGIQRTFVPGHLGHIEDDISAFTGCLWPYEVIDLAQRKQVDKPQRVTGPAGTLILFDSRGLHRVKPLSAGSRTILSMQWIAGDRHN